MSERPHWIEKILILMAAALAAVCFTMAITKGC